ncbi:HAD family hydrolase [Vibrio sp. Isolate31]|uniref:HAD family hydrolase n=1 Tax=unclassified Vibrio TaxID=2614977 RepID=UPI001EFE3114|nr:MULTISPECIES: HAD family hydrolase [unclassified Vibrio]MCG9552584.1 HAD family hydrolase [Vibrio sp. Isolate32]MCG9600706.1 HAD family hydrolase [Vibrio sp. Isolate31]
MNKGTKSTAATKLTKTVLFDWGNTLMIDFPDAQGKMCDWETVKGVSGAQALLAEMSKHHNIYIATNAADSSKTDIIRAFERVGLSKYIDGYFCKASIGLSKYEPGFYPAIISQLGIKPQEITMIGDTLEKDIYPALEAGLQAVWLNTEGDIADTILPIVEVQNLIGLLELCNG